MRIHQTHSGGSLEISRQKAMEMMQAVGIPDPQGSLLPGLMNSPVAWLSVC